MTRRIMLTLAEDVTETHCGSCPRLRSFGSRCGLWGWDHRVKGADGSPRRRDECLAAERAASRMLDVTPEDAAAWRQCVDVLDLPTSRQHAKRCDVEDALREHAKKAESKP